MLVVSESKDVAGAIEKDFKSNRKTLQSLALNKCLNVVLPPSLFCLTNLTHLSISNCRLFHLPRAVTSLQKLVSLSVKGNMLDEVPDLSSLLELSALATRDNRKLPSHSCQEWGNTREAVLLLRKQFYYGGARKAAMTLLLIKKHAPDSLFSKLVARDVVLIIAKMIWKDRSSIEWAKQDKIVHDMENYHCVMPVPFASIAGPSCFVCHCGVPFGDIGDEKLDTEKLKRDRGKHFGEKYFSDEVDGKCSQDSLHIPINRAVQMVLNTPVYDDVNELKPGMDNAVLEWLEKKCQGKVALRAPIFPSLQQRLKARKGNRRYDVVYASLIREDVIACIIDFLSLRAASGRKLMSKLEFAVFANRTQDEQCRELTKRKTIEKLNE